MTLPEKAEFPPCPSLSKLPEVIALAVASSTDPVVMVSLVSLATLPPTVSIPKAWNEALEVAAPPMATSQVEFPGEIIWVFNCQRSLDASPNESKDTQLAEF